MKLKVTVSICCLIYNILFQAQTRKLEINHLTGGFYVYTTYQTYEGFTTPAHGLYVVTKKGVVLIDTPWDTTQLQPLLDSIKIKHQKDVKLCIATHWHSDRTDGLEYYQQKGIQTYTSTLTDFLSKKHGKKRAANHFSKDTVFTLDTLQFETFYPGEGHTQDNIVLWFPKQKILYGGCLIKGATATNLGYLGDGNIQAYLTTLQNVQFKYPKPKHILVSHHDWTKGDAMKQSIKLAKKLVAKGND